MEGAHPYGTSIAAAAGQVCQCINGDDASEMDNAIALLKVSIAELETFLESDVKTAKRAAAPTKRASKKSKGPQKVKTAKPQPKPKSPKARKVRVGICRVLCECVA